MSERLGSALCFWKIRPHEHIHNELGRQLEQCDPWLAGQCQEGCIGRVSLGHPLRQQELAAFLSEKHCTFVCALQQAKQKN